MKAVLLCLAAGLAVVAASSCIDCPEYVALSAKAKQDRLWSKITATEYDGYPNDWIGGFDSAELLTESMNEPFDRYSDQMPADRLKLIHTLGAIAKVKFVHTDGSYTGMFEGADYGLARLSLAKKPPSFTPGMALKFLRDGTYSGNVISMYELSGQGNDYNFFKNQFKTWVNGKANSFVLKVGSQIFSKGASDPTHLSVDNMGAVDQKGYEVRDVDFNYPGQLYFKPNSDKLHFDSEEHEFREDLATIDIGTKLYDVYATHDCLCSGEPCEDIDDCDHSEKIGELVTDSNFVASSWGDAGIFFQHYRFAKKGRRTCVYANDLDDETDTRLSGALNKQCVAGSCPKIGGHLFGIIGGSKAKSSSTGCPFHLNERADMIADPLDEDDNVDSTSPALVPALVGCTLVFVAVGLFVALRFRRHRGNYANMEPSHPVVLP